MFQMREESMLKDSFKLSVHRVFQSVGLCPIITDSDPTGTLSPIKAQQPREPCARFLLANFVLAEARPGISVRIAPSVD
jgi:hypothetical protein